MRIQPLEIEVPEDIRSRTICSGESGESPHPKNVQSKCVLSVDAAGENVLKIWTQHYAEDFPVVEFNAGGRRSEEPASLFPLN